MTLDAPAPCDPPFRENLVYCAGCEHACSAAAASCPSCGHPLTTPERPIVVVAGSPRWAMLGLVLSATTALGFWIASLDRPSPGVSLSHAPSNQDSLSAPVQSTSAPLKFAVGEYRFLLSPPTTWNWKVQTPHKEVPSESLWLIENQSTRTRVLLRGEPHRLHAVVVTTSFTPAEASDQAIFMSRVTLAARVAAPALDATHADLISYFLQASSNLPEEGAARQRFKVNEFTLDVSIEVTKSDGAEISFIVFDNTITTFD